MLRNGEVCWSGRSRDASREQLVEELGARPSQQGTARKQPSGATTRSDRPVAQAGPAAAATAQDVEPVVTLRNLCAGRLDGVDIVARSGEIVGLAGLEGAGQRDVLRTVFRRGRGSVRGEVIVNGSLAYVAGDRAGEGNFALWDIYYNILIGALKLKRVAWVGVLRWKAADRLVEQWFQHLDIAATSPKVKIRP